MVVVKSALLGKGGRTWAGRWGRIRASSWRGLRIVAGHLELTRPIRCYGIGQKHSTRTMSTHCFWKRFGPTCKFGLSLGRDATRKLPDAPLRRGCLIREHLSIGCCQAPPCSTYGPRLSTCSATDRPNLRLNQIPRQQQPPSSRPRVSAWYLTIRPLFVSFFSSRRTAPPRLLNSF